jgi:PAS domain S-box-containing protein
MSFAKSAHPMWIYDRQTLAFIDVNDAAVREYGYSRQWFLSMTILDICPATDIPKLLQQTRDPLLQRAQNTAEEWHHQTKNGVVFPVAITSWELTCLGRPARLVLARRESPPNSWTGSTLDRVGAESTPPFLRARLPDLSHHRH